ncbi:ABC transporter ATP-binding protein [Aerococcus sp. Group 1]|uniref:ABC transporter ATP-binding protein n=1 Tax=Aerococcus urinae (strain CCUG 59500 / ACS-120-V-Col10a) TaxID=2976812 RepID=UPI000200F9E9|nr:ABC transporter ATP-binding protein [Aerococcus sp. Group 1]AEA01575.1 ABC transporter, ATP-binding protein [Aerococcus sp. Group 1]MCY3031342.1 ABC transporter ATP-binding protein [Aerococcus sp. Group 1]MCY3055791.1 ABC transporter ATP-binding protein [Aerococcus sp. Group 1]MCY3057522.1 ABC transporter ATP-binding protein [Aerococcus sp. Group 1]MCY3062530.1 ABC transporter ATP-binding protein [Aerococcus sp. Group 1]
MLQARHLRKTFGDVVAVDDVSFDLEPGKILGMIGRNGSGKTTIFRLILNFLTPENGGEVLWNDKPMSDQVYDTIGYLPEERGLYEKMTIEQQILYFAQLRGMEKKAVLDRIDEWMERFEVKGKRTDKINSLSKGNQQKVQLIATLIHEPDFIILDEPFSGLDPVNADLLKQGILYLRDKGSSIIFSSHNMNNVEAICDDMLMIHDGEQVLYGKIREIRESFGRTRIEVEAPDWTKDQLQALEGVDHVVVKEDNYYRLYLTDESYGPVIFQSLTQGNYIRHFSQQPPTLEEIFKMKAGGHNE